jgi:membrane protein DedA with SNARE-associated domain
VKALRRIIPALLAVGGVLLTRSEADGIQIAAAVIGAFIGFGIVYVLQRREGASGP